MQSLLYIGHSYHNKTQSTQFLQNILKTKYEVTIFDYDPYQDSEEIFAELKHLSFDIVVLFQIMPNLKILYSKLKFKNIVFFPMFDTDPDFKLSKWHTYKDCTIINFSKTVHERLVSKGFSSHYIQYFPKPIEFSHWGDKKSLFFWQRTSDITIETIEKLFKTEQINHLHFHKAIDPDHEILPPSNQWTSKTTHSTWYEQKEDMLQDMQKSALYMAPRKHEGIGQSFLEAMAMGRCVIAPNLPTMNEYIEHGKTGLLYELDKPHTLQLENISTIQQQARSYIEEGYTNWEDNKKLILDWLEFSPQIDKKKFMFYEIECLINKFIHFCFNISTHSDTLRVKIFGIRVFKFRRKK